MSRPYIQDRQITPDYTIAPTYIMCPDCGVILDSENNKVLDAKDYEVGQPCEDCKECEEQLRSE